MKIKEKIKELLKNVDKSYIIIFLITVMIFLPYISNKFIKGDDYICHVSNIYAMKEYITSEDGGIIPTKIRSVMANDLGYGNGIFYPQLAYYITIFIYMIFGKIGFSLITCMKIYEFIVVFLSGVCMYKFMIKTLKKKDVAIVTTIMYICSPYFIFDVFGRIAYTEILTFLFIPIIMLSINYLLNKDYKKFLFYFVIGYSGMICSHLVLTVFFTILLVIILLINIKQILNKKAILTFILGTVIVLGITSPFTIPMLEHKIQGNYVVFQEESMASLSNLNSHKLELNDIVNSKNSSISVAVVYTSIIVLIFIGLTFVYRKEIFEKYTKIEKRFLISIAIFTILAFVISSKIVNWGNIPKTFWNIQFPWRMCTFIAFGTSILAGFAINIFKLDSKKIAFIIIIIVCFMDVSNVISREQLVAIGSISKEEVSSMNNRAMGSQKEYLPVNAKNNIDYLKQRNQEIVIERGNAKIEILQNNTPFMQFDVKIEDNEKVVLEIPRIFYLGYDISLKDENNNKIKIDYYENDNGFIEFEVSSSGIITVDYTGTTLNKIANICSIILCILFLIYFGVDNILTKKKGKIHERT